MSFVCFFALDFFPEMTLGDGPENSQISVNVQHTVCYIHFLNEKVNVLRFRKHMGSYGFSDCPLNHGDLNISSLT